MLHTLESIISFQVDLQTLRSNECQIMISRVYSIYPYSGIPSTEHALSKALHPFNSNLTIVPATVGSEENSISLLPQSCIENESFTTPSLTN